jgi:AraC family transcriptional regulator of adaptative response/methylated-DNA-[protein]-cysteine methyltransferase
MPAASEMIRAFMRRDATYDGVFLTGVTTTGIFCRPSCPARKPRREHLKFFPSAREAVFAGFRACKRCRPLSHGAPAWVDRLLTAASQHALSPVGRRITDRDVRRMGLEPATVRRYFLKRYGMTFHAYARARRLSGAFQRLRAGASLDEVAMDGFESHSGFRDAFVRTFGTAPGRSRTSDCIVVTWVETPLGPMVAGANTKGLCLLEYTDRRRLEGQIETMRTRFKCAVVPGESPIFEQLRGELAEYFRGERRDFTLPLVAPGTPFQEKVWTELLRIPCGETWSYEQLARAVGVPKGQRAVGLANGMNRIAIVIPCHRVVNKSGKLGGYGGLLWRKAALLELERTGQLRADSSETPEQAETRFNHGATKARRRTESQQSLFAESATSRRRSR